MLHQGDSVPHFSVTDVSGARVSYSSIWQQKNLLLVSVPDPAAWAASPLSRQLPDPDAYDAVTVVTADPIAGVPSPGIVIADRWGEVVFATGAASVDELPSGRELASWLEYVQNVCPECQGETK